MGRRMILMTKARARSTSMRPRVGVAMTMTRVIVVIVVRAIVQRRRKMMTTMSKLAVPKLRKTMGQRRNQVGLNHPRRSEMRNPKSRRNLLWLPLPLPQKQRSGARYSRVVQAFKGKMTITDRPFRRMPCTDFGLPRVGWATSSLRQWRSRPSWPPATYPSWRRL